MGGAARLAIAFELIETVRTRPCAGILARHPAYTAEDLRLAWARLTLGDDLCRAVVARSAARRAMTPEEAVLGLVVRMLDQLRSRTW